MSIPRLKNRLCHCFRLETWLHSMLSKFLSYKCSPNGPSACMELNSSKLIIKWITPAIIEEYERWKIYGWSCRQEQIASTEWYPGFYCFIIGMLFDDHLYISSFIYGAAYILKSLDVKFSTRQVPKSACVIFPSPFISYGSSLNIGYEKKRKYRIFHFILCQLEMERPRGFIRTLTRLHRCLHGR